MRKVLNMLAEVFMVPVAVVISMIGRHLMEKKAFMRLGNGEMTVIKAAELYQIIYVDVIPSINEARKKVHFQWMRNLLLDESCEWELIGRIVREFCREFNMADF